MRTSVIITIIIIISAAVNRIILPIQGKRAAGLVRLNVGFGKLRNKENRPSADGRVS